MAGRRKGGGTPPYEKLGAFYLGKVFDPNGDTITPDLLLYDSKDLTTHGVCVGMTGSGKTGLCVSLLEEAAIDGVPAIAIDPKGDLGNLLLTFPKLRPSDFRPWVDEGEAARKGATPEEYAAKTAELWRNGLADWGEDSARIQRLRESADFALYTPGSSAGLQLNLLRSFAAPPSELVQDPDAFRERLTTAVSGLLALLGLDADPLQSREHILVSNLFDHAWRAGEDLDLASLIQRVQSPPFEKIGVMDLDSFFPAKDRTSLAMNLNSLLASPGFAAWMEGEPLEVPRLLWTEDGRPRVSILSIAHLSDAERMFFVTLLLNEVIGWMRTQSGTSSLRALLYMDEVFGFFPPVANPPSKTPMLTLLKQARAYGLGVLLATQNPVDLDYKGLSNAGTWFLGRLQTERDKMRVIEGLEGASATAGATFDRQRTERILAGLKSRVFLMNNVHDDQPVLFHTRWAMSYLRGPLTRSQIQDLMAERKGAPVAEPAPSAPAAALGASAGRKAPKAAAARPVIPPDVPELFAQPTGSRPQGSRLLYRPSLVGTADLHFANARADIDRWETVSYVTSLASRQAGNVWSKAEHLPDGEPPHDSEPRDDAAYATMPAAAGRAKSYTSWKRAFKTYLYQHRTLSLWKCKPLKLTSSVDESEADFRVRVREAARERRDTVVEKLRKRYSPKLARLQDQINRAETRVSREESQYGQQKAQTAISMGATVLGALFGRKLGSVGTVGRATTTMRGVGRAAREREDIARAKQRVDELRTKLVELEAEFEDETAQLRDEVDPDLIEIEELPIRPRKADITVGRVALLWLPFWVGEDGIAEAAV
jgi:hypothetical protein